VKTRRRKTIRLEPPQRLGSLNGTVFTGCGSRWHPNFAASELVRIVRVLSGDREIRGYVLIYGELRARYPFGATPRPELDLLVTRRLGFPVVVS